MKVLFMGTDRQDCYSFIIYNFLPEKVLSSIKKVLDKGGTPSFFSIGRDKRAEKRTSNL